MDFSDTCSSHLFANVITLMANHDGGKRDKGRIESLGESERDGFLNKY